MHFHDVEPWQHSHNFGTEAEKNAERHTRWVVVLTLVTMVVELVAGWLTGSMALLADGWHMGSHAAALGLSVFAYGFARRRARDARFTFGTGKVPALAGYSSALLLGAGALWMLVESLNRLLQPIAIHYSEAMAVATLGLLVNLASAWILSKGGAGHHHHHDHANQSHYHGHEHQDHNLRAAYLHVLADALTSLLAISALGAGMLMGWAFLDPLMGIVGAALISRWAWGLAIESSRTLLDAEDHSEIAEKIREGIESNEDARVSDLHVWRVGASSRACIVSIVTHEPKPVEYYKALLRPLAGIDHLTVEVQRCSDAGCRARDASRAHRCSYCTRPTGEPGCFCGHLVDDCQDWLG